VVPAIPPGGRVLSAEVSVEPMGYDVQGAWQVRGGDTTMNECPMYPKCGGCTHTLERLLREAINALEGKKYDFNEHRELAAWKRKNMKGETT
jgi:hypothetical protein